MTNGELFFAAIGVVLIWSLDETYALYQAVFSFSYENLGRSGPQQISGELLRYTMTVVSIVNVQAILVPVMVPLASPLSSLLLAPLMLTE